MTAAQTARPSVRDPMINIYSHDVGRLVAFYERLGFRETFRTPQQWGSARDRGEAQEVQRRSAGRAIDE